VADNNNKDKLDPRYIKVYLGSLDNNSPCLILYTTTITRNINNIELNVFNNRSKRDREDIETIITI